jgi:Arc/MetJ family transcription regulator
MSKYITTCALSVKGTRIEKGQEIELDDDFAKGLASDLIKVGDEVVTETVKADEVSTDELSLEELKAKAKELGLSTRGSKADLIERISLADKPEGDYAD